MKGGRRRSCHSSIAPEPDTSLDSAALSHPPPCGRSPWVTTLSLMLGGVINGKVVTSGHEQSAAGERITDFVV